jgi:hypothetical protein
MKVRDAACIQLLHAMAWISQPRLFNLLQSTARLCSLELSPVHMRLIEMDVLSPHHTTPHHTIPHTTPQTPSWAFRPSMPLAT